MKRKVIISVLVVLAISAVYFLRAGSGENIPKPRGYFRIALPEKQYSLFEAECPVQMEIPGYAKIELFREHNSKDSCWFNIFYARFNARIHCTYLPVTDNFEKLIRDAYDFAASHEMKASGLRRTLLEDSLRDVYGIVYDIEGDAASQVQFFFTDSSSHFFRGSLYFFNAPNPDSVAPVLGFIHEDIMHLATTLQWK